MKFLISGEPVAWPARSPTGSIDRRYRHEIGNKLLADAQGRSIPVDDFRFIAKANVLRFFYKSLTTCSAAHPIVNTVKLYQRFITRQGNNPGTINSLPQTVGAIHGIRFPVPMIAILILAVVSSLAGGRPYFQWSSDTAVTIIKAEKVIIEKDKITIIAKAKTSLIRPSGYSKPGSKESASKGKPSARIQISSDKATFIIKRPPLTYNDGQLKRLLASTRRAEFAKELDRGQFKYQRAEWWKRTLQKAKALRDGKKVWPIRYYKPTVVIKENGIESIEGYGYFYAKKIK